jgi:hypothetical protein
VDRAGVSRKLNKARRRFKGAQRFWSATHFTTAYGAAFIAAVTAALAGLKVNAAVTASFAIATGVLAAATRVGRFEDKWRSARLSRGEIDGLINDLAKDDPNLNRILDSLTRIIKAHDEVVVRPIAGESSAK